MYRTKDALKYVLCFMLSTVFCAFLITVGNDLLRYYHRGDTTHPSILDLGYAPWLPVCALIMGATLLLYFLLSRFVLRKACTGWLSLSSALLAILVATVLEVSHLFGYSAGWYEVKNGVAILVCGAVGGLFSKMLCN